MINWPSFKLPPINLYNIGASMSAKDQEIFLLESQLEQYQDLLEERNSTIYDLTESVISLNEDINLYDSGEFYRDYIHVEDVADAINLILEKGEFNTIYNVGNGIPLLFKNMIEYAFRDKHVVIVSPTSFLAYLQTVLQGLRAMEIEESAKSIRVKVDKLNRHWRAFDSYVGKLGKTLMTTVNHFNYMYKELGKVDKDVMQITERKEKIVSPEKIDKPQMDE